MDNQVIAVEGPTKQDPVGEYVLNKEVVKAIGKKPLDLLNFVLFPRNKNKNVDKSILSDFLGMSAGGYTESVPGYSHGGYHEGDDYSYDESTGASGYGIEGGTPDLQDLYSQYGYEPSGRYAKRFQEYNPEGEQIFYEDYMATTGAAQEGYESKIGQYKQLGQLGLEKSYQKSLGLGKGFSGFGEREQGMGEARSGILKDYLTKGASAKTMLEASMASASSTLQKGVKSERDRYVSDIYGMLDVVSRIPGATRFADRDETERPTYDGSYPGEITTYAGNTFYWDESEGWKIVGDQYKDEAGGDTQYGDEGKDLSGEDLSGSGGSGSGGFEKGLFSWEGP